MNDKSIKIVHFASLLFFLALWAWLIRVGAFREGNPWIYAGFFVQGGLFVVGCITQTRVVAFARQRERDHRE